MIAASKVEEAAAKEGAAAGAKARDRELDEAAAQTEAILAIGKDRRSATWRRTYRVGGEVRETPMRETARREVDPATLLKLTGEAIRLAAGRLHHRHGIPELPADERADLRSALVAKLLEDAGKGRLPERAKLTKAYLVKRAEGMVLNDPERQHTDAALDGADPEAIAAAAESRARAKHDRHDPMLNRGVDGTWPEIARGCDAVNAAIESGDLDAKPISRKAARTAAYLVAGGSVRDDWSLAWGTSEGYAATRLVPEGAAQLREHLSALRESPLHQAIKQARREDRDALDQLEGARRWLAQGMADDPAAPPRKVPERRWRVELPPELHAPLKVRTDKRIIRTSGRSRALASDQAGWTAQPK